MQYVGKLVSSVYNTITPNINPSTLTGAIDVIVVEREVEVEEVRTLPDGTTAKTVRNTTELASSPFHVRFGKMSVLRPDERKVTLHLNDSPDPLPFAMKVGENGEAFFVMKVENMDDPVPDALVTSPVVGPVNPTQEDPVPLSLGESHESEDAIVLPQPDAAPPPTIPVEAKVTEPHSGSHLELDLDMEGYKLSSSNRQRALKQGQKFASELPLNRGHGGNNPVHLSERLDHPNLRWQHQLLGSVSKFMQTKTVKTDETTPRPRRVSESSVCVPAALEETLTDRPERPRIPISRSDSALYLHAHQLPASEAEAAVADVPFAAEEEAEAQPGTDDDIAGTLTCAPADPYLFQLRVDDNTVYSFELSLCSIPAHGAGDTTNAEYLFDEGRVSFQRFLEDDSIVKDPRLCIRHNDQYHYRETEAGMFSTLAFYRDVLVRTEAESKAQTPAPKPSVWSRLWRGEVESKPVPPKPEPAPTTRSDTFVKTLRLSSDQLKQLGLRKGENTITFSVTSSYSGVATCRARVFLWDSDKPVVVSDIDGTITKSDALGHVFTLMGRDWTHLGVAKLYHDIAKNGYRLMYLTSRAIGQADITRDYLRNINQNNYQLPDGPVIMSPDRLIASLHREVILRKPEIFKMACLRDIARLFGDDPGQSDNSKTPFYAGFGNRITDALSYRSVNIPSSRIFTIDSNGEVKMELLELAGYHTSYPNMTDLVDQMFPPVPAKKHDKHIAAFTDFNYWRDEGLADIDLPPDDELVPVVSPSSPPQRGVRSPRMGSRRMTDSPRPVSPGVAASLKGSAEPVDVERPSRIRRLLGLSRRPQRIKSEQAALEMRATSPDFSDASLSPPSLLPGWGSDLSITSDDDAANETQETNVPDLDADDDTEDLASPEARRRYRRRRQLLYGSLSLGRDDSLPRRPHVDEPGRQLVESPAPQDDEDPLLAAGDIQFEWRG